MLLSHDRSVPPLCMHNVTLLPLYYNIINSSTQALFQSEPLTAQRSSSPFFDVHMVMSRVYAWVANMDNYGRSCVSLSVNHVVLRTVSSVQYKNFEGAADFKELSRIDCKMTRHCKFLPLLNYLLCIYCISQKVYKI